MIRAPSLVVDQKGDVLLPCVRRLSQKQRLTYMDLEDMPIHLSGENGYMPEIITLKGDYAQIDH